MNYQPQRPYYDPDGETQPASPYDPNRVPQSFPPPQPPPPPPAPPPSYPPPWRSTPEDYLGHYQPVRSRPRRRRGIRLPFKGGCCVGVAAVLGVVLCLALAFVAAAFILSPGKTNILVLGIDRIVDGTGSMGRSDTIVMVQVDPLKPRIATLAIPRDLWVTIPGVGENRINTAHYFAEINQPGSGPAALAETINENFGIASKYYVRIHLEGVPALIDAMGGVTIDLKEATALYPAGQHHLNGTQALAFVRDRKEADDFFRMDHGELFIKAVAKQLISPLTWPRLPLILAALPKAIDTNIPTTSYPALALALLRVGPANIDSHTIQREDTTPFVTSAGAQVLLPNWDRINSLVAEIFGN